MNSFVNFYLKSFEDILGIKLGYEVKDKKIFISAKDVPKKILNIDSSSINKVIKPIEKLLGEFYHDDVKEKSLYKHILITKYIYHLINPKIDLEVLDNFVEEIKSLSNKTYEQSSCEMGFIIFNDKDDIINDELLKLGITYIPFTTPISVNEIKNSKQALKLIDSLSLCYVVDSSYKILGIAKKKNGGQSIANIMSNRYRTDDESLHRFYMYRYFVESNTKNGTHIIEKTNTLAEKINQLTKEYQMLENAGSREEELLVKEEELISYMNEHFSLLTNHTSKLTDLIKGYEIIEATKKFNANKNIQFVTFNSGKIEWFINDSLVCILSNGKWHIRNYKLIFQIILEYILRQHAIENVNSEQYIKTLNKLLPRAQILHNNIKSLSDKNIGALLILLKHTKYHNKTIYKELLSNEETSTDEFIKIIKTNSGNFLNIYSCDSYLFELISSVDGAVLLDRNFNFLSFGEMINNSISTPPFNEVGARTLAAIKASMFGLSIKISEDGDISIFENGLPIIKL